MNRTSRALPAAFALFLALTSLAAAAAPPPGAEKFERTLPFVEKEQKIGIKFGDAVIESVKILNWPDAEDFRKGEKDLTDTKTMWVVFTYTNRGDRDVKCKYIVTVPGPKGEKAWAENDANRTLDAGKVDDTNRLAVRMKTHQYKLAKTFKVAFEIWKK